MQYTTFLILAPIAAILSIGVAIYAWRSRTSPETTTLVWLIIAATGWVATNTFELAAPTPEGTLLWAKLGYLFVTSTAVLWLTFALHYTGQYAWLKPARFVPFCIIPAITVALVLTNEAHTLVWRIWQYHPVNQYLAIHVEHGPWFWINVGYEYLLVLLGAYLIIRQSFRSFNLYRQQSIWLVAGAIMPILANMMYAFHLVPGLVQDYTSVSFAVAGIFFVLGIVRHRLFDLTPIARDAVVHSMSDAMLALDHQGRVVDLNPAAQAILDMPNDRILGQPAERILHRWGTLIEEFEDTLEIQTDIVIHNNGAPRYYDLRISPLFDRRSAVSGRLVIVHDITDRKLAEVALRERTEELEARNEQLDAFAHTVAHDIKDPLTTVVGYSSLLREFFKDMSLEEINGYLDTIADTSSKIANIVDALLLLSSVHRIDDVPVDYVDMNVVVNATVERLTELAAKFDARLILPKSWPDAWSYSPWVEEIWVNYVSNAIKYGGRPDEGIRPRVELGWDMPDGEHAHIARFWVKDNGLGLTDAQQARLFAQFTHLRGAPNEGYGLGLSIVRSVVEKLGTEAGIESQIGEGSMFWFTLPTANHE